MTGSGTFLYRFKINILPVVLSFFLLLSLSACANSHGDGGQGPQDAGTQGEASARPDAGDEGQPGAPDLPANPDAGVIVPEPPSVQDVPVFAEDTPPPSETVSAGPDLSGPDVPEREPVDDEFFSDAAFLGNSLVDGFRLYSGLTTCDVYAATSMSVAGIGTAPVINLDSGGLGTIYDGISQKAYGKIYILLGINEIGYMTSSFKEMYAGVLDKIAELQPEAYIYIMSLTPISAHRSATDSTFTMSRIAEYNEALYELAQEKGCYYIDLIEALSDDTGFLPASSTTDGIHFSAEHYKVWLEYLRTHYI